MKSAGRRLKLQHGLTSVTIHKLNEGYALATQVPHPLYARSDRTGNQFVGMNAVVEQVVGTGGKDALNTLRRVGRSKSRHFRDITEGRASYDLSATHDPLAQLHGITQVTNDRLVEENRLTRLNKRLRSLYMHVPVTAMDDGGIDLLGHLRKGFKNVRDLVLLRKCMGVAWIVYGLTVEDGRHLGALMRTDDRQPRSRMRGIKIDESDANQFLHSAQ